MVAGVEGGAAQGVLADDLEVLDAVEQQVHAGDGGGGEHLLLAVELAPQGLGAAAGGLHVFDDLDEHAARAAGRVVDALALDGVEDVDEQTDDRAGGVVLAGLLVRLVGEALDEVLVRVAEHVRGHVRVGECLAREVLDQVGELAVGQLVLVGPVGVAEDAVERLRVGLLDLAERRLQGAADVLSVVSYVVPQVAIRNGEAVILGEGRELVVAAGLLQRLGELLQVDVTDPLEEHQRKDVRLEVGLVDAAAENVGGLGKVLLQLGQGKAVGHLAPSESFRPSWSVVPTEMSGFASRAL